MAASTLNIVMSLAVILGIIALFLRNANITRWAVGFLGIVICLRELSIYVFHKTKLGQMAKQGTLTDNFTDGALLISNYCRETRLVMLFALLLLIILGYWWAGRRDAKQT